MECAMMDASLIYEGSKLTKPAGIKATKALLEKVRGGPRRSESELAGRVDACIQRVANTRVMPFGPS